MGGLYRESNTGLWCRENTLDEYVIKEQSSYKELLNIVGNRTVMDIGANIGAFAYSALQHGCKKVISIEPDPDNIKMYKKQHLDSILIEGAASDKNGYAKLYINSHKNKGLHSLQPVNGRESVKVKTYSFIDLLEKYRPSILKIDIEGGEYGLPLDNIPSFVKAIAIEIHLQYGNNRDMAVPLIKSLKEQFPRVLHDTHITEKNWTTLFIGRRKKNER